VGADRNPRPAKEFNGGRNHRVGERGRAWNVLAHGAKEAL
jgi:hypothetical protein